MIKVNNRGKGPILNLAPCRCCRELKRCRILTAEYSWMEKKEIYSDMVMDCFGILLSYLEDIKDAGVCATCVDKLRDACVFRQQVLESENLFLNSVLEGEYELAETNEDLELSVLNYKPEPRDDICEKYEDVDITVHSVDHVEELNNDLELSTTDLNTESKDDEGDHHSINDVTTAEHSAHDIEDLEPQKEKEHTPSPLEDNNRIDDDSDHSVFSDSDLEPQKEKEDTPSHLEDNNRIDDDSDHSVFSDSDLESQKEKEDTPSPLEDNSRIDDDSNHSVFSDFGSPLVLSLNPYRKLEKNEYHKSKALKKQKEKIVSPSNQQTMQNPLEGKRHWSKRAILAQKQACVSDISTILEHSNATPFKTKLQFGYRCFFCSQTCEDLDSLRGHQASKHRKCDIVKTLKTLKPIRLLVYVDITDLTCTICSYKVQRLDELKSHMTQEHKKKFHTEILNRIIPFKLSKENMFECPQCGLPFASFRYIERHMSVHYKNDVCSICGAAFLNKSRLNGHIRYKHGTVNHQCNQCDKVYNRIENLRNHINTAHKMIKLVKCPKCPERFINYQKRQRHLEKFHEGVPFHKCNKCSLTFRRGYKLRVHIEKKHSKKNYACELCLYKTYCKDLLRRHIFRHNGVKKHECDVCARRFVTKCDLTAHTKRIHGGDFAIASDVASSEF